MDLLHGARVFLSPGRYVLRPSNASVTATARTDGWTLATSTTGTLVVEYDVVDTQTGNVVLHDRAQLSCGNAPAPVLPRPAPSMLPSVAPVRGAAQVDGRGLPLATFDDVLPRDSSVEQPSPFVRSRIG